MKITPIKTRKIRVGEGDIYSVIFQHIKAIKENSILVITSKIVSICEGRVMEIGKIKKEKLVEKEADLYLPPQKDRFRVTLTIKNNILCSSSGVDESNGDGYWVLWPESPQKSANLIRQYISKKHKLKNFGVIITDSKSSLLRRGASGIAIAYSGFLPLKSYVGKKDIFGKKMKVTKANLVDSLATSAVLVMGEGAEQTPMALVSELDFIDFKKNNPGKKELAELQVDMDNDYFKILLKSVKWRKGGK